MAMTTTTVRLDTDTKAAFDRLCKEFGMSVNTAITIFVNKVV
jgi:DNA-damage-inducible protein J